jgi:hypothetical protein
MANGADLKWRYGLISAGSSVAVAVDTPEVDLRGVHWAVCLPTAGYWPKVGALLCCAIAHQHLAIR